MVVEHVEMQVLPFVVEPISPARVKLWARFASQITSDADVDIASHAYTGFWYDNHTFKMYDYALAHVEGAATGDRGSAMHMVEWLELLVSGLLSQAEMWSRVVRGLEAQAGDVSFARQYQDAQQRVVLATQLVAEVRSFGVSVCQFFGFALPQYFVEESTSPTVPAVGEGVESLQASMQ